MSGPSPEDNTAGSLARGGYPFEDAQGSAGNGDRSRRWKRPPFGHARNCRLSRRDRRRDALPRPWLCKTSRQEQGSRAVQSHIRHRKDSVSLLKGGTRRIAAVRPHAIAVVHPATFHPLGRRAGRRRITPRARSAPDGKPERDPRGTVRPVPRTERNPAPRQNPSAASIGARSRGP